MSKTRSAKGFYGYEAELEEEIFEFQRNEYPERDPRQIRQNWRWMFLDSATRLGMDPPVWLYRRESAVVAHQGAIPVRLQVGDDEVSTGWFVETMAAAGVRGSAIGPMLIKKALEDMPLNLSLGQTQQMREIQYALGWRYVCSLKRYVFVSGFRMNLRNKLPAVLADSAALALGLRHDLLWRRMRKTVSANLSFRLIDRFTSEHDALWRRMASTCTCAVVRDASYLNWKYVDRPSRSFERIEMRDGDEPAGVLVVAVAEPNDVYRYRRGYFVDFIVPLNRPEYGTPLIVEGIRILRERGAQTIVCQCASAALDTSLKRFGFIEREPRHQFLVAPGPEREPLTRRLLEPRNWFLTLGDSDADAYAD